MVDPIGPRPVKPSGFVASVTRASAARSTTQEHPHEIEDRAAQTIAHQLSAKPPVDASRVDALRRGIADGTYRIDAAAIADRMLAARTEWVANDPA
ncbi:flagellar biosynthesis anti-sigma factor FlgM [Sphingomonas sp. AX6]|uniref:flagellar biosynthesis anti-sigma factor FlgM n=1 Tax=Sphingomonas sp. AX6 TaxID=2653171 RepID=UPI0012EF394F|nr:flagellar biosynthesis anti-sigma factor FlgM [Sphingomonas sp. AX6]VXC70581.1 Flagellar biosynthesis anti-sigma factor FlgM [Sphingomonas sp. AX6]